jgi:hypothetical protein
VASLVFTATPLTSVATTAKPVPAGPARRLDGGVECEQRGLFGDMRDEVDDVSDGGGRGSEPVDVQARFLGGCAREIGKSARVAYLGGDIVSRQRELFRRL